jgi:hypothetical protein
LWAPELSHCEKYGKGRKDGEAGSVDEQAAVIQGES